MVVSNLGWAFRLFAVVNILIYVSLWERFSTVGREEGASLAPNFLPFHSILSHQAPPHLMPSHPLLFHSQPSPQYFLGTTHCATSIWGLEVSVHESHSLASPEA